MRHRFDPGVVDAFDVQHKFSQVRQGDRLAGQNLGGTEQALAGIAVAGVALAVFSQQVGQLVSDSVSQIGDGIAELFQDRDAGIVGVEIGP